MASTMHPRLRHRLRSAVAGAAVAGAAVAMLLTAASAAAAPPTPMGAQTDAGPRSLSPGFLLDRGRYLTIEAPGATVETGAGGINNRGVIVGGARGGGRPDRGFLRDARGRYTTIRFPGARSTLAQKLNDRGQLTGLYSTTTDGPRDNPTGFLLDRGRYIRIAVPGAFTTTAVGINNRGQVVGQYQTPDRRFHGYVRERGRFRTIDAPGAVDTTLFDINDRGQIVGFTSIDPATETARGFLLARGVDGPFTSISSPGAPSTVAFGLNDRGQITGTYNNPNAAPPHRGDGGRRVGQLSGAVTPPLAAVRRTVSSPQAVS